MKMTREYVCDALLAKVSDKKPDHPRDPYYYRNGRDNLVTAIPDDAWEKIQADFAAADGKEMAKGDDDRPKFNAVHSSSALAVNAFGIWRTSPAGLVLPVPGVGDLSGFKSLRFEQILDTGLAERFQNPKITSPNMDVFMTNDQHVVACESKLAEPLQLTLAKISPKYVQDNFDFVMDPEWADALKEYNGKKLNFDVAQIIKHYFGLKQLVHTQHGSDEPVPILLYLFWEPVGLPQDEENVYQVLRKELTDFAARVKSSSTRFVFMSYPELWGRWEKVPELKDHVGRLRQRYEVDVSGAKP